MCEDIHDLLIFSITEKCFICVIKKIFRYPYLPFGSTIISSVFLTSVCHAPLLTIIVLPTSNVANSNDVV